MNAQEVQELIPLLALGVLDADEAAAVEAAVAGSEALRAELDAHRDALVAAGGGLAAEFAGDLADIVAAVPAVRDRLMASVDALSQPGRWDRFASRIGQIFDVTLDKARMFLSWVDDPKRWESTPVMPGVDVIHLPGGPRWAAADCGFVRMPAGLAFPWHGHKGEELTFVLAGRARDSSGVDLVPGGEYVLPPGAEHDYVVDPASGDYIFAVRFYGIELVDRPPT